MASTDSAGSEEPKRRFGRRKKKQRDPNNPGRIAQVRQVFQMTRRHDPSALPLMLLAFFSVVLVALAIGLWLDLVAYCLILGIPLGILAAVAILGRRAERAAFTQIEGQPGAPAAVLGSLRRGWFYEQEPVAAESGGKVRGMRDLHNAAMVYRAVGRPGVVLITEGPRGSAQRLSKAEQRKVTRVVGPEVPVHCLHVGKGDQDVPLHKLTKRLRKLDKSISKQEAVVVHRRLQALGRNAKPPVPAGMDPRKARVDRRALRGR